MRASYISSLSGATVLSVAGHEELPKLFDTVSGGQMRVQNNREKEKEKEIEKEKEERTIVWE